MMRAIWLVLSIVVASLSAGGWAHAQTGWTRIVSTEIDPRAAGKTVIDVSGEKVSGLRFVANGDVVISSVKTTGPSLVSYSGTRYALKAGVPSSAFFQVRDPQAVGRVAISWAANPSADGVVIVEIWGRQGTGPALSADGADRERKTAKPVERKLSDGPLGSGPPKDGAAKPAEPLVIARPAPTPAAPAPASPAPKLEQPQAAPPSPSMGGAPVATEAAPSATRGLTGKPAAAPLANVCADTQVCTLVDVFYGTDRNQVVGADRVSFGAERPNRLTLGHAFVTVPKAKREKGTIPLPTLWDRYVRGVPADGDPARHFTIPQNGVVVFSSEAEFLAAAKKHIANAGDFKNHAFIFVHGFYVGFESALYRTAQIAYDLSPDGRPFGTAFLYSWPSAGNASAYVYDQDSAQFSVPHLQSFIKMVVDKTGVENVHIIAHSMGNVALIGALQEYARTEKAAKINQIILAAPDLDKQQFETIFKGVESVAKGMTLYASQGDKALALARKMRGGTPRAGESIVPPGPAVVSGIETIDVSAIGTAAFWGHDTYADSKELLTDITALFTTGVRPASKRNDKFKLLQQGALQYWKYAK
jgi:esterase/lipase superfamily enzyme